MTTAPTFCKQHRIEMMMAQLCGSGINSGNSTFCCSTRNHGLGALASPELQLVALQAQDVHWNAEGNTDKFKKALDGRMHVQRRRTSAQTLRVKYLGCSIHKRDIKEPPRPLSGSLNHSTARRRPSYILHHDAGCMLWWRGTKKCSDNPAGRPHVMKAQGKRAQIGHPSVQIPEHGSLTVCYWGAS
ncbi:hypothetical protein AC578_8587 [Pseudocercospora eumusae]|uniref:Uncharacterized protein n=1 Tax=Pseudocercospora eumusae TaxID=321146 RepID=A0A139HVT4_9PEZI|nr:hypothetical protein AC578_8587 [Pseudocercospora eumusae]